ncbi:flagellar protein FlgN [Halalkalibacter urbisdiaboli]|uniref:flagellar protein FlgN n=1 Tax=Halalkalibacter urbisdiaboli TaxID=1960589 RepID=UPI000B44BD1A|nr:flagellar protein FlgN [Halalkalibacter urbisdiaboli]
MSAVKLIIQSLAELIRIHQQLNELASKKVDSIKQGDMPALEALVREESKLASKLRTTELMREKQVHAFFAEQGEANEHATISSMIALVSSDEANLLQRLQKVLVQEVNELKKQNELNQSLIQESLQFVNLSLDLLIPNAEDVSYKRPQAREERSYEPSHSIFDSKA